jgi:cysteine desulfurase family protein (TIGR01976 family)
MAVAGSPVTIEQVRAQFPALKSGFAFFENAGGSQVPRQVLDRISSLMTEGYVQTGAGYPAADMVDGVVADSKRFANVLVNGEGAGTSVIGPSTTDLLHRLAGSLAHSLKPGDEVVISVTNHESNVGPWVRLARGGVVVKWWGVDRETGTYSYDDLESLLTDRTKIVAVAHTSNLLGDILDARRVVQIAHAVGARVVVDGVAFAPHRTVDVQAIGADFYALSLYKVYGPHIAILFGTDEAWSRVEGQNHFFLKGMPSKFELGCQPYELLAGLLGTAEYFSFLAGNPRTLFDRPTVESASARMMELEMPVQERIFGFLSSRGSIRLVGPPTADQSARQPTFSFLHSKMPSDQVVKAVNGDTVGIRYGHMYAARLCEALGAPLETGFVRVSAVHYNSVEEADRLVTKLDKVL